MQLRYTVNEKQSREWNFGEMVLQFMRGFWKKLHVFSCLNLPFVYTFLQDKCTSEKQIFFFHNVTRFPFLVPIFERLSPVFKSYIGNKFSEFNFKILKGDLSYTFITYIPLISGGKTYHILAWRQSPFLSPWLNLKLSGIPYACENYFNRKLWSLWARGPSSEKN